MTVIPLGGRLLARSSHLPAGLREPRQCLPIWCCSGWRLPRFTRDLRRDSSLWPYSSPHGVRPLAVILLCGARTFLHENKFPQRLSDLLHGFILSHVSKLLIWKCDVTI